MRKAEEVAKKILVDLAEMGCCDSGASEDCEDSRQPEFLAKALESYAEEAYERGKQDVLAIHTAKWSKDDYQRGRNDMAEECAEFCWDKENADKCRALAKVKP